MAKADQLARLKDAAERIADALMNDRGGFCLETLHALTELCDAAGLPDGGGVTSATDWTISGEGDENVRFFGTDALHEPEMN